MKMVVMAAANRREGGVGGVKRRVEVASGVVYCSVVAIC